MPPNQYNEFNEGTFSEMAVLLVDDSKYISSLWSTLEELRMWVILMKLKLPPKLATNISFSLDQFEEIQSRHEQIEYKQPFSLHKSIPETVNF